MKTKTWRNPIKQCVLCLYQTGCGVKRIERITRIAPSVAARWVKRAGISDLSRRKKTARWTRRKPSPEAEERRRIKAERAKLRAESRLSPEQRVERNRRREREKQRQPRYRLINSLRLRLRKLLRGRFKKGRTLALVGCNREFFVDWIQRQFQRGMAWDNYGTLWHLDHIVPCASFDLSNADEQRRCFHYSNLRPMLADANRLKSDSIEPCQPELVMDIRTQSWKNGAVQAKRGKRSSS